MQTLTDSILGTEQDNCQAELERTPGEVAVSGWAVDCRGVGEAPLQLTPKTNSLKHRIEPYHRGSIPLVV